MSLTRKLESDIKRHLNFIMNLHSVFFEHQRQREVLKPTSKRNTYTRYLMDGTHSSPCKSYLIDGANGIFILPLALQLTQPIFTSISQKCLEYSLIAHQIRRRYKSTEKQLWNNPTPLSPAAGRDHAETLQTLLDYKARANRSSVDGMALQAAAASGQTDMAQRLHQCGAGITRQHDFE